MLKKEAKKHQAARDAHGITASANGLYTITLHSLALVVATLAAVIAFLILVRQPLLERNLVGLVTDGFAEQRAQAIAAQVSSLRERATSASRSMAVKEALAQGSAEAITRGEQQLQDAFPEAISLRLLPLSEMGTAERTQDGLGLRNHIEVDLVRRASNGEDAGPEAYQVSEQWLISIAVSGAESRDKDLGRRAVLLVTLPQTFFRAALTSGAGKPGELAIEQRYVGARSSKSTVIAGAATANEDTARAAVADTPWTLLFTPSASLLTDLRSGIRAPLVSVALLGLAAIAALFLVMLRYPALLRREVARTGAAAEHRTPFTLRVPELMPLARELRKLTLRRARLDAAGGVPRVAPAITTSDTAQSAPALTSVSGPATSLPQHIFRAYDIRGLAEQELDDETVYRIGAAIGTIAGGMDEQTLILGYDGRASSGRIKAALEKALLQSGRDVIDIGLVPTPMMYFATHQTNAHSGVMVTGSHNPAEYNGLKIVLQQQTLAEGSIDKIRNLALSGKFSRGNGHMIQQDIIPDYLDEIIGDIAIAMPLKIVIDAGNGATGHIAPTLFEELGCEVVPLYCEVDGRFPNHPPDTSNEDNLRELAAAVTRESADFGIAFDGDGDRVAAVTGSGRIVRADTLLMLFAQDVVARNPGADVVYDVKCSNNLGQLITRLGGRGVLWKTGHALMKQKMAETGAILGGEFSGHMFFAERWFGFDDGMYAAGRLAEILSSGDDTLDELIDRLPRASSTPEFIIPVDEADKFELIRAFRQQARFPDGRVNDLDGVRVDFSHGWGLLRASNTSAALTARFEGSDDAALEDVMSVFRQEIAAVHPDLDLRF
ncbi:MAG: phosphomannomutase/phosphoglucomutase [Chromatocurvus sp.]